MSCKIGPRVPEARPSATLQRNGGVVIYYAKMPIDRNIHPNIPLFSGRSGSINKEKDTN